MPLQHQGFRTTEITQPRIKEWFTNNQPDFTQEIFVQDDADQFAEEKGINKVYLFSTKKATPPIYQALAANLNNRMRFAIIKKQYAVAEKVAKEFNVEKWPTMLVQVQTGPDAGQTVVYDGKLKLPELKAFMEQYALDPEDAKEDYAIASKKKKESPYSQNLNGMRIVEDVDEMKELIIDEHYAALVYVASQDNKPHLEILEKLGRQYGEFINIVALLVEDPASVKKEFKGKLPMFRFYKNELKGQAKRD